MIESVVGLLMFINGEIKEHRIQEFYGSMSSVQKVMAERQYSESVSYKCWQGEAETEIYLGEKSIKKIILSK